LFPYNRSELVWETRRISFSLTFSLLIRCCCFTIFQWFFWLFFPNSLFLILVIRRILLIWFPIIHWFLFIIVHFSASYFSIHLFFIFTIILTLIIFIFWTTSIIILSIFSFFLQFHNFFSSFILFFLFLFNIFLHPF